MTQPQQEYKTRDAVIKITSYTVPATRLYKNKITPSEQVTL